MIEEKSDVQSESWGINIQNEKLLHLQLKQLYADPGDRLECKLGGYIIDIVKKDTLVEIQTANFSAISKKLCRLLQDHKVILVHPIFIQKNIIKLNPENGETVSKKKSPAKGNIYDIFSELIRIPHIISHPNLSIHIVMAKIDELRCMDGKGSWRRKGESIVEKRLNEVVEIRRFSCVQDYENLVPEELPRPFTNKQLAEKLSIRPSKAAKMAYCLKKMNIIEVVGKKVNAHLYDLISENAE